MGCSPWGHKESDTTERLSSSSRGKGVEIYFSFYLVLISVLILNMAAVSAF